MTAPTLERPEDATVASLEAQLNDLYKGVEHLRKELGTSEADDIITMFQSLQGQLGELEHARTIENLEAQLCDLYKQREALQEAIGLSDPFAIVRLVKEMEAQLVAFYRTRDQRAA
jgi:regulator of replication initiation timing